ncbi:hypothetical protein Ancab_032098 [Ancistrocladus abbreviatus]
MVVCNIDSNRKASVSSESGTRRNIVGKNDLDLVSAEAKDVISEFQSPINDVLREATLLKATDKEVGQLRSASTEYADGDKEQATGSYPINDKLNLFPEEGFRLGLSEDIGPVGVMSLGPPMQQGEELGYHSVEALNCVSRLRGLQVASWAGLGSMHNQANASKAPSRDIADVSIQNQKQNINHSKGHEIRKSGGCPSFSKVFKRRKASKANGNSSASKQSPADNPSTWLDLQ